MEPQFKTSFIPKQSLSKTPAPKQRRRSVPKGIGFVVSLVIFLAAAGTAGSFFLYKQYLEQSIEDKTADLRRARDAFQPSLIEDLARLDMRLSAAQNILSQHIAPSVVFSLLEQTTLKSVRYSSMSVFASPAGIIRLNMRGVATSFTGVALQSDVLGSNQYIQNLVISGLENSGGGEVAFSVSADLDPRLIEYERTLSNRTQGGS